MILQQNLDDFRNLPDDACILNEESSKAIANLIEANKSAHQNLFEFKLLEKERIFPGEKFNLKTEQINKALNSIDSEREDICINQDIEDRLKNLTIQEELIEKRDIYNDEINRKFDIEEIDLPERPVNEQVLTKVYKKPIFYSLADTQFDEERTMNDARAFLKALENNGEDNIDIEHMKAIFNKEVMKNKIKNEEEKPDLKKMQEKLSMLSFYEDFNN